MSPDSVAPQPIATWNPNRLCWETDTLSLFCEQPEPYSETWPRSGSMRNGQLFAPPTSEPPTTAPASSSSLNGDLLPTPAARDAGRGAGWGDQPGRPLSETVHRLLPTPRATDGTKGGPNQAGSSGDMMLPSAVQLFRTPTAQLADNGGSQHPDKRKSGGHGPTLADEVEHLLPTGDRTNQRCADGRQPSDAPHPNPPCPPPEAETPS